MLIVGLGNIGKEYEGTYHNVGFMFLDKLAMRLGVKFSEKKCKAECATFFRGGEKIVIAKPTTFMNSSGESVRELVGSLGVGLDKTIIVFDDFDLPLGTIRIRKSGSAGTHNGMRSIINCLASEEFPRIRIGIGKSEIDEMSLVDFVLSKIKGDKLVKINAAIDKLIDAIEIFLTEQDTDKLMQRCN